MFCVQVQRRFVQQGLSSEQGNIFNDHIHIRKYVSKSHQRLDFELPGCTARKASFDGWARFSSATKIGFRTGPGHRILRFAKVQQLDGTLGLRTVDLTQTWRSNSRKRKFHYHQIMGWPIWRKHMVEFGFLRFLRFLPCMWDFGSVSG